MRGEERRGEERRGEERGGKEEEIYQMDDFIYIGTQRWPFLST
jgi:hypothetical protein